MSPLVSWPVAAATARERGKNAMTPLAPSPDPAAVLDREIAAYNTRNMEAFLSLYASEAELFEFPDKSLAKGKEACASV